MENCILVIEDEQSIVTLLEYNLQKANFQVEVAYDGKEGLEKAIKRSYELIILDLMLPQLDGMEICKQLRMNKIMTPILMLTAKSDEFDRIFGLEMGADDYMTKPFSPREVVARVKAILRRTKNSSGDPENHIGAKQITIADLRIIPESHEVYFKERQLELTLKEYDLLLCLVQNKGRVITRDQLLQAVWQYEFVGDSRIVDVHISHLREKIESDTRRPKYIKTIRGLGYKLEEPRKDG